MNKIRTCDLFDINIPFLCSLFSSTVYPWELLPKLKDFINNLILNPPNDYTILQDGILMGKNVEISPLATIIAPCIIGHNTIVRPGAYLRGYVIIGSNCVVGNSTELKHCVLLDNVQVPHYNYVGDSILGNHSHLGAGVICSNLKNDKSNVIIKGETNYETYLRKVGCFLGDNTDIGCNSVLNPGTVVGKNTKVYPLSFLRGVIKENCIVKQNGNIINFDNFNNT